MTHRHSSVLATIALPASLLLAAPTAAQWLPNGNDIYYNQGNVGIGGLPGNRALYVQTYTAKEALYAANFGLNVGSPKGIFAYAAGVNGIGVEGFAPASTGKTYGVLGRSGSEDGAGVLGYAVGKKGGKGVWGIGRGDRADGVFGEARNNGIGVRAIGTYNDGVFAELYLGPHAVHGIAYRDTATGLYGEGRGKGGIGVEGFGRDIGVRGVSGGFAAVKGETSTKGTYGVFAAGDFGATGARYFVQPHPTDPALAVRYVCLEGNESGTYFRGTMRLVNGRAEIAIPEDWQNVSEEAGITVQVTPLRSLARLTVWEKTRERIVIAGDEDCEFDYFVNGVRRGFADFEPTVANRYFQPEVSGEPFGGQYPNALRQILVENGTLNPDFTPNENTAARLGWDLRSAKTEHGHGDETFTHRK